MGKWDSYSTETSNNAPPSKWAQYTTETPVKRNQEGDSWGKLIGKSIIDKGIGPLLNLPNLAAQGIEGLGRGGAEAKRRELELMGLPGTDIETPEITALSSRTPTWEDIRDYTKDKTGVDLKPKPTNAVQRIASEAAGFATPGGLLGLFGKGAKALNAAKTGAIIGGTSGALQEGGVNPLAADLFSIFALPTGARAVSNTKKVASNLLNNFTKAGQEQKIRSAAGDILKDKVGAKNIDKVLNNLNSPTPFNADLTTAERANNTGISSLHRALAPNIPAIAEKEALTENILRKELNQLSPKRGLEPSQQGELIRNYLDKELQNRISTRSNIYDPLHEKVNLLRQEVDVPKFEKYLQEEGQFAKGDIAKAFNYLENVVKNKSVPKGEPKLSIGGKEAFDFKNLSPEIQKKLRKELEAGNKPIPPELSAAVKAINSKLKKAKKAGDEEVAKVLAGGKANLLEDMLVIPEERIARNAYAQESKKVDAIKKQPLLGKIVKKDIYKNDFLVSPEKIPEMILRGSLNDTKALISEIGADSKTLNIVRGSVVDKLINSSELSSVNAAGQSTLSYTKVNNLLKKNKEKLKYIFNEDQVKVLEEVNDVLKRRNMVATMGRGVGSNTQSQTTLLEGLTNPVKKSLINKIANKVPGGRYLTPLFEMTKKYEKQQIISLLEKALLDPQIAKSLLTPIGSLKTQESLKSILTKIGIPATAYSFSRQEREGE